MRKINVNVSYTLYKSLAYHTWCSFFGSTFLRISFLLSQKKNIEYDMPKICTKFRKHCCKYQFCFIIFQSIFTSQSIRHIILDVLFLAQEEKKIGKKEGHLFTLFWTSKKPKINNVCKVRTLCYWLLFKVTKYRVRLPKD